MAVCPECKHPLGITEVVCPECKRDFRYFLPPPRSEGLAYGRLAEIALVIGQIVAGLACVLALIRCIVALVHGEWLQAFLSGPIAFFVLLAVLVVLMRAQDAGRSS